MPLANDKPLSEHQKPLNWNLQQPVACLPNAHLFCNMAHFQSQDKIGSCRRATTSTACKSHSAYKVCTNHVLSKASSNHLSRGSDALITSVIDIDDNKYFIGPQLSLIQLESTKQPFLNEPLVHDWC